ncbi:hypothetical protein KAX22_11065, partial [bacterium]|nr:hypothetical protein [bacterium]
MPWCVSQEAIFEKGEEMIGREDVQKRVIKVTSQVLRIDQSEIGPELNFVFDLGAESIDSITLV